MRNWATLAACIALWGLAGQAHAQTAAPSPSPVAAADNRVTVTGQANRFGAMPADPVADLARRVLAACGDVPGQPHVTPEAQVKTGIACGVLIYGLDGDSPKEYTPYPIFWIVGVDGDPKNPTVYIVGAKGKFQLRKRKASDLLRYTSEVAFQGSAHPALGPPNFSGGVNTFKFSYRTILWPAYCANPRVVAIQGCGESYNEKIFHFFTYTRDWDYKHRRDFESADTSRVDE